MKHPLTPAGIEPATFRSARKYQVILSCVRVQFDEVSKCDTAIVSPYNEFLCRRYVASVAKLLQVAYRYWYLRNTLFKIGGPGSTVGLATDYGLDGPESNPGGDEIFRPSIPALGPTQPPVKWVLGLSRG